MDEIPYEPNAFYIFDKGYYDLARLYRIQCIGSMFIIRAKEHLKYEIVSGDDLLDGDDNVLLVRAHRPRRSTRYSGWRIVYYAPELKRTFTFLTNDFSIKAKGIAMLYKQR